MSHPSDRELRQLDMIADELVEVFNERGHRVEEAMAVDPAFGSGHSRAWVTRDLAVDAVSLKASHLGVDFRSVNGAGREFRFLESVDRRYRFLRGARDINNQLRVAVNSESSLTADPGEGLYLIEQWAMVWVPKNSGVAEVLAGHVVGVTPGRPGVLVFGEIISLGQDDSGIAGRRRFASDDNDDIFGDEDWGDEEGTSSG